MEPPIRTPYFRDLEEQSTPTLIPHSNSSPFFTVRQLASIYEFPSPTVSISTVIGVMSFGGGLYGNIDSNGVLTNGDVQKYWAYQGFSTSQMPKVIIYRMAGVTYDVNDYGGTAENTLDVSVIGSCCPNPNLTIILYLFPMSSTLTNAFQQIINGVTIAGVKYNPTIISLSWGAPESYYLDNGIDFTGDLTGLNTVLSQATQKGINVCVASGDSGANDGTPYLTVDFPSSCPYVIAVGGTSLICPNKKYDANTVEKVWNNGNENGSFIATGGGISAFYTKPNYQSTTVGTKRNVPDIAFNSDPKTGIVLILNGLFLYGVGGTSMAAPLFAGFLALINANTFMNPILYRADKKCFHDILVGTNGDNVKTYSAGLGYDNCSGLGSVVGIQFASLFSTPKIMITNISISPLANTINMSQKNIQFYATIVPSNATNKNILWKSSHSSIANVINTGLVFLNKPGTVTITASTSDDSKKVASTTLTIISSIVLAKSILLSSSNVNLNLTNKRTDTIKATILPSTTTNKKYMWLSSNSNIVNVNKTTGLITAVNYGTASVGVVMLDGSNVIAIAKVNITRSGFQMRMVF